MSDFCPDLFGWQWAGTGLTDFLSRPDDLGRSPCPGQMRDLSRELIGSVTLDEQLSFRAI